MGSNNRPPRRDSTRIVLDPPTFMPSPEMRAAYLQRHKNEVETLMEKARAGEWKTVYSVANHVRGSGAMYGFKNIGEAAENLSKAIQNGETNCFELLETYAGIVAEAYV